MAGDVLEGLMPLEDTLFVGWKNGNATSLPPVSKLLAQHVAVRDAVTEVVHGEMDLEPKLWPYVAMLSFTHAFNTYKAIELVLPELYHEAASAMLRQLWEVSLNLHWMERDPDRRAQDFCNFTVMEFRKQLTKKAVKESIELKEFDEATKRFQEKFHFQDRHGRMRRHDNFSASTIESRSRELGDPWHGDSVSLYPLTSMQAHGAPGAILWPTFRGGPDSQKAADEKSAGLVALVSIRVLIRDVHLLVRQGLIPDATKVDQAWSAS